MLTNAPREKIKPKDIYKIYRLRWSIELVFKLWKSKINFEELKGYRDERVLFELYGKLICILLLSLFNYGIKSEFGLNKEISLFKSFSRFKLKISKILSSILSINKLSKIWLTYKNLLYKHGLISKTGKRKTSLNELEKYNKGGYQVAYSLE